MLGSTGKLVVWHMWEDKGGFFDVRESKCASQSDVSFWALEEEMDPRPPTQKPIENKCVCVEWESV